MFQVGNQEAQDALANKITGSLATPSLETPFWASDSSESEYGLEFTPQDAHNCYNQYYQQQKDEDANIITSSTKLLIQSHFFDEPIADCSLAKKIADTQRTSGTYYDGHHVWGWQADPDALVWCMDKAAGTTYWFRWGEL